MAPSPPCPRASRTSASCWRAWGATTGCSPCAAWEACYAQVPQPLTRDERRAWLDQVSGVALSSDAFFPFRDSIDRASRSGVRYIAQPGGSVNDQGVIAACDEYGMVMALTETRLFHH